MEINAFKLFLIQLSKCLLLKYFLLSYAYLVFLHQARDLEVSTGIMVDLTVSHPTYPSNCSWECPHLKQQHRMRRLLKLQHPAFWHRTSHRLLLLTPWTGLKQLDVIPMQSVKVTSYVPEVLHRKPSIQHKSEQHLHVCVHRSQWWALGGCSFWSVRGRQICQWWSHQCCTRLWCKTERSLQRSPYTARST